MLKMLKMEIECNETTCLSEDKKKSCKFLTKFNNDYYCQIFSTFNNGHFKLLERHEDGTVARHPECIKNSIIDNTVS